MQKPLDSKLESRIGFHGILWASEFASKHPESQQLV